MGRRRQPLEDILHRASPTLSRAPNQAALRTHRELGATRLCGASPAWRGEVAFKTSLSSLCSTAGQTLQSQVMEPPEQKARKGGGRGGVLGRERGWPGPCTPGHDLLTPHPRAGLRQRTPLPSAVAAPTILFTKNIFFKTICQNVRQVFNDTLGSLGNKVLLKAPVILRSQHNSRPPC